MSSKERKKELLRDLVSTGIVDKDDVHEIFEKVTDFDKFENEVTIALDTSNLPELSEILSDFM